MAKVGDEKPVRRSVEWRLEEIGVRLGGVEEKLGEVLVWLHAMQLAGQVPVIDWEALQWFKASEVTDLKG